MLRRIEILQFALIEHVVFEPQAGFNIITGETGAGKSLLIDALTALKGNRMPRTLVRIGAEKAIVEGVFDFDKVLFSQEELEELEIDPDEDFLFIRREIFADSKSICKINGKTANVSLIKKYGSRLVDIHGQHDQQAIFSSGMHLGLLDRLCEDQMHSVQKNYRKNLQAYKVCIEEMRELGMAPDARNQRLDFLSYQIDEIENADLKNNEDEELMKRRKMLAFQEKLQSGISNVSRLLESDEEKSVLSMLSEIISVLENISSFEDHIPSLLEQVKNAYYGLESAAEELSRVAKPEQQEEMTAEQIDERLHLIDRIKRKYGDHFEAINAHLKNLKNEHDHLKNSEKRLEQLNKIRHDLEMKLLAEADELHRIREEYAEKLSKAIIAELHSLGMSHAVFSVSFTKRPKERFFSRNGYDEVEFLFSANQGEPERPLAKIASGGEASRIMLAIKTILSQVDETPTLIFDEIDTGISGKAAQVVAEKLRWISNQHQVLCITHMAQIAAAADQHFYITKKTDEERTQTMIEKLDAAKRIYEVSRLLSGNENEAVSMSLAQQMIQQANERAINERISSGSGLSNESSS